MIVSCLSRNSQPDEADCINDDYVVEAGTSMACPFTTGIVALLLERDPTLDSVGVKKLLKAASAVPGAAAGAFDPKWGFGLIDASKL
jgi:subtilisin family serine protease